MIDHATLQNILSELLKSFLAVAFPFLITWIYQLMTKAKTWFDIHVTNTVEKLVVDQGMVVAMEIEQTIGEDLKKQVATGTLSWAKACAIMKTDAMAKLKSRMNGLTDLVPELESKMSGAIESAVMQIGLNKAIATVATAGKTPDVVPFHGAAPVANPTDLSTR